MIKNFFKFFLPNFAIKIIIFFKNIKKIINDQLIIRQLRFYKNKNIIHLGTNYGGWTFIDNNRMKNQFIISAGLGEDASFDIELINKYNCKIISIDPTPRAVEHYNQIIKNKGSIKTKCYAQTGVELIDSYNLQKVNEKNFILLDYALHNEKSNQIKFYSPPNKKHVSHSINDWQNNYSKNGDFIKVKTIKLINIVDKFNIKNIEIIKLDIEGSEVEVINNMLQEKIFPNQILVEFDELNKNNKIGKKRFIETHKNLLIHDYLLIQTNQRFPDMLYVRKHIL